MSRVNLSHLSAYVSVLIYVNNNNTIIASKIK